MSAARPDKAGDAAFLADEFGIKPATAADLVAETPAEAEDIAAAVRQRSDGADALRDAPTPAEPADELTQDNDEVRLKPVVRQPNTRTGAG